MRYLTSSTALRHPRRLSALTLIAAGAMLSGCTGEPSNPAPAPSTAAPTAAAAGNDATPKVPGGKGDLMEGIPKK